MQSRRHGNETRISGFSRVAIVTGATRGIGNCPALGRACARARHVVMVSRERWQRGRCLHHGELQKVESSGCTMIATILRGAGSV